MFETIFQNVVAYGTVAIWIIVLVAWAIWYFKKDNIVDNQDNTINEFDEEIDEGDKEL